MIKKYGVTLLENIPDETTKFLIKLCTNNSKSDFDSVSIPLLMQV